MTASRGASIGTKRTLEPLPVTFRRRSPFRPSIEPRSRPSSSREAQAREQRGGDKGEVALGPGVACVPLAGGNGFEQAFGGTLALEGFGHPRRDLGLGNSRHRVADDHLFGHEEAEELVPGRPGPGDAGSGVVVGVGGERPA